MTKNRVKSSYFQRNAHTWAMETRKSSRLEGLKKNKYKVSGEVSLRSGLLLLDYWTCHCQVSLSHSQAISSLSLLSWFNRRGRSDLLKGSKCFRCPLAEYWRWLHGFTLHSSLMAGPTSMCMQWGSPLLGQVPQQNLISSIMAWASILASTICDVFRKGMRQPWAGIQML